MILNLAVYHSSQDFKNSDSSSGEDEQEKVVHQEPPKNNMRENEHQIIRDYIYNWKMNLENGLKKAKDHVLKNSSSAMKKKFKELDKTEDRVIPHTLSKYPIYRKKNWGLIIGPKSNGLS